MFNFDIFRKKEEKPLPVVEKPPLSLEEREEFRRLAQMYEDLDQSPTVGEYSREHGNLSPEQTEDLDRYFTLRKKAEGLLKFRTPLS